MGKILCATRGGEESEETRALAIELARLRGDALVFLYVADASFLDRIAAPVVVDVEGELGRMGRFQLVLACEQAAEQGVTAEAAVRHGHLRNELIAAVRELCATLVVLGRPRGEASVFDEPALHACAECIRAESGVEVRIL